MNTGALSYEETDLSLPGVNGLDLNFVRRYNTEDAQHYFTVDYLDGNAAAAMAYEVGYELYPLSAALTKDGAPENADLSSLKITNVSAYTFSGEPDGKLTAEPEAGTDPNAAFTKGFTASEAKAAEELYDSLADSVYLDACRDGVAYRVQAQRYLRTIEPAYSTLSYTDLIPDNECVKKFGLGQGWTLGFSHIDEYPTADGSAKYLISAEGRRYKVQFTPYPGDSNLEDYTLEDMRLENNGNGYPGASYTLFHKDGKREYFNAAGLNIAIVDRFDNAITLAYTFSYWSEFSSSRVTRINITDTVGRQIVYQEEASGPWPPLADPSLDGWRGWVGSSSYSGVIGGDINEDMDYNCKWTLSVDNHVVREYYINNLDLILPPPLNRVSLRTLVGVKKVLQTPETYDPDDISLSSGDYTGFAYGWDSSWTYTSLLLILYPNDSATILTGHFMDKSFGEGQILDVSFPEGFTEDAEAQFGVKSFLTNYREYGLGGLYADNAPYESYMMQSFVVDNFYLGECRLNETYTFNADHQKIEELRSYYTAGPDLWTDDQSITYAYDENKLPSEVNITHYNPPGTPGSGDELTENYAYEYDEKGNLLSETKPNGRTITYTYSDEYSLPLTIAYSQDAAKAIRVENTLTGGDDNIASQRVKVNGQKAAQSDYTYNAAGQRTAEKIYTDATHYIQKQYVYGNGAQVTEEKTLDVRNAAGALVTPTPGYSYSAGTLVTRTEYNGRGRPVGLSDAAGNETEIAYDAGDRVTRITYPDGTEESYSYEPVEHIIIYSDEYGNPLPYPPVSFYRDASDITYTDPYGTQYLYRYDTFGNETEVYDNTDYETTGERTLLSAKGYDQWNRLIETTTCGAPSADTVTYYGYDGLDRVLETGHKDAGGNILYAESYQYLDGSGKTIKTISGDANSLDIVSTEYRDNMGNIIKTGRMLAGTEYTDTYTYDYVGNRLREKTAYTASLNGSVTNTYTYDYAGRVTGVTNALSQTAANTYDWAGRLLASTDHAGSSTAYTYDSQNRLLKAERPFTAGSAGVEEYTYDQRGNLTQKRTANNLPGAAMTYAQTDYEYDARGQLAKVAAYDNGAPALYSQYTYDGAGKPTRMYSGLSSPLTIWGPGPDDVLGQDLDYSLTQYAYDRYGNLAAMTDPLGYSETNLYDLHGNLIRKTDRNGDETDYTYDAMGRPLSISSAGDYIAYTYTQTDRKQSESNSSATITYTYDSLGRLATESGGGAVKTYAYNRGDERSAMTVSTGGTQRFNTSYAHDALNRLTGLTEGSVTAAYGYDVNGNRNYLQYNNGLREEYAYNAANLITGLTHKRNGTTLSQYGYTYALDGNQATKTEPGGKATSYTYDGLGRLSAETETVSGVQTQRRAYAYDDASNRTQQTATGSENYQISYEYDRNNRLMSESKTGGSSSTYTYTYDHNGNQLTKKSGGTTLESRQYNGLNRLTGLTAGSAAASYAYNPSGLRAAKTVNGTQTQYILDGENTILELSSGSVRKYVRGQDLISSTIGGDTRYYLYNAHGDVTQLTDSAGNVVKSYEYDAFGNEKNPVPSDPNPFRYCGEYLDLETNTYYLRARYYNPTTGRFLTEDPARDGLNWYTYAGSNPVMFIDPSGLVYIMAWSYGSGDVKDFEKYYNWGIGRSITADGDTSDWTNEIWAEFGQKSSFARAAYTKKKELMDAGVPESEIIVQRIDNKEGLAGSWDEWAKLDVVDGLDFYSHGYSGGAEVYRGSGTFWSDAKKLTWGGDSPYAKFHGCNTANGEFAQNFANTQGVITYGQTDYSNFSGGQNRYTQITTHGTSLDVYMGVYNRFLGIFKTFLIPMKAFYPE